MKIGVSHFFSIKMIYENLGSEVCDVLPQLHAVTGCHTTSYKLNVGKFCVFKKVYKDPSNVTLIKLLGLKITLTENLSEKQKYLFKKMFYQQESACMKTVNQIHQCLLHQIQIHFLKN